MVKKGDTFVLGAEIIFGGGTRLPRGQRVRVQRGGRWPLFLALDDQDRVVQFRMGDDDLAQQMDLAPPLDEHPFIEDTDVEIKNSNVCRDGFRSFDVAISQEGPGEFLVRARHPGGHGRQPLEIDPCSEGETALRNGLRQVMEAEAPDLDIERLDLIWCLAIHEIEFRGILTFADFVRRHLRRAEQKNRRAKKN